MERIQKECIVNAPVKDVWTAWTTTEGVKSFFGPDGFVDLRLFGPYEIYFNLDAGLGQKGSEGCRILGYLPQEMLSFSWNAPPEFGGLRGKHTFVVVRFQEVRDDKTRITLSHLGWGEGGRWAELYEYFENAWDIVLKRLIKAFEPTS